MAFLYALAGGCISRGLVSVRNHFTLTSLSLLCALLGMSLLCALVGMAFLCALVGLSLLCALTGIALLYTLVGMALLCALVDMALLYALLGMSLLCALVGMSLLCALLGMPLLCALAGMVLLYSLVGMSLLCALVGMSLRIITVYRIPPSKTTNLRKMLFLSEFPYLLEYLAPLRGKLLIFGDMNIHWDDQHIPENKQFALLIDSFGLTQYVLDPTHVRGHTRDMVLARESDSLVTSCEVGHLLSDHHVINTTLRCGRPHPSKSKILFRKIKGIDVNELKRQVTSQLGDLSFDNLSPEECVLLYDRTLTTALDNLAPVKTKTFVKKDLQPWMNDRILEAKRDRRKAERKWRGSKLTVHHQIYKEACCHVNKLICQYYSDMIQECDGDTKALFRTVNTILGKTNCFTIAKQIQ
ncbi:uncharacterized protein LOC106180973 isoform X2 [Lingula anatina]|uniref:Uncharacterized protein LOC106180973 isoform X2 n=1 Tax=Lingula anatina TaxID=7574 RepID=A0A1S3KDC1_LINAN|nr:uncharacterized protein LOC106180973 isoform X2 [Lingula anatina]|eukprot:XP_013420623.1 uncharacterized protein LOC106180973 isoform X2 [Lingula anatina]